MWEMFDKMIQIYMIFSCDKEKYNCVHGLFITGVFELSLRSIWYHLEKYL